MNEALFISFCVLAFIVHRSIVADVRARAFAEGLQEACRQVDEVCEAELARMQQAAADEATEEVSDVIEHLHHIAAQRMNSDMELQ